MIVTAEPLEADALRLRHEFLAMPALCLTPLQAARLVGVRVPHAEQMLDELVVEGFLMRTADGLYRSHHVTHS